MPILYKNSLIQIPKKSTCVIGTQYKHQLKHNQKSSTLSSRNVYKMFIISLNPYFYQGLLSELRVGGRSGRDGGNRERQSGKKRERDACF